VKKAIVKKEEVKKVMNRKKAQLFEGWLSIVVNAALFALKFWVGLVTGSVALMADAWHTMSDSLTSIIVVFAAKLASKKPDKEHPFGHGRWELICTILIGCILAFIGYEFLVSSIERFRNREEVIYGTIALVVTIVSIIIKELLAQTAFYIGRKTDNSIVSADGWHHRTDSLSSVVVLIGILTTKIIADLWWMDSVLGIFCALAIFYAAFRILQESAQKILGEEPPQELIEEIKKEISDTYGGCLEVHHFHIHCYITQKELTIHIRLPGDITIEEGHKIATNIENMIHNKFDMVTTIHLEPLKQKQEG
jgi:cation diffusion facilitator family transporter